MRIMGLVSDVAAAIVVLFSRIVVLSVFVRADSARAIPTVGWPPLIGSLHP
jgi:hypothetical protein